MIPLFVKQLMNHESPTINGDGSFSRDFTFIDNVIQMNVLCLTTQNEEALNQIYNTACGERTTLIQLVDYLKKYLSEYDSDISNVNVKYGPKRKGDVPHSLASVQKAKQLLNYKSSIMMEKGIKEAVSWYWLNLK